MTSTERLDRSELIVICAASLLGVVIRLIHISQPFVDHWSFRQSLVAMIAENFYRHGFNILYPQINSEGPSTAYVGTEFPLVPFLASLGYVFFGIQEWVGRSISVFFFAASVPFFYLYVRQTWNKRSAMVAVVAYTLSPVGIFAGRSFMSDMASLSCSIAGLHFFGLWLRRGDRWLFLAAFVATSLAILVKPPAIIVALPMLYMAQERYGLRLVLRPQLWAFAGLSLILPLVWYCHAFEIARTYYPYYMFGEEALKIQDARFYFDLLLEAATFSLTPIVFGAMLVGSLVPSKGTGEKVFHWWLLGIVSFSVIAGWGNRQPWYHLPLVAVAAAFTGRACDFALASFVALARPIAVRMLGCLAATALAYLAFFYVAPLYEPWALPMWKAGVEINRLSTPSAVVVVVNWDEPTTIYYSGRKGWHFLQKGTWVHLPADGREAVTELEKLRKKGATYLVFTRYTRWWLDYYKDFSEHLYLLYPPIADTNDYVIFDLLAEKPFPPQGPYDHG